MALVWLHVTSVLFASLGKGLAGQEKKLHKQKHSFGRISIIQAKNVIHCCELKGVSDRFMGKKRLAGWRHKNHDLGNP